MTTAIPATRSLYSTALAPLSFPRLSMVRIRVIISFSVRITSDTAFCATPESAYFVAPFQQPAGIYDLNFGMPTALAVERCGQSGDFL